VILIIRGVHISFDTAPITDTLNSYE